MEQRRARRFTLQLPVFITRNGTERVAHSGLTRNISSGGVLFTTGKDADIGISIEYLIKLSGANNQGVNLRCIGKVLRSSQSESGDATYDIAATLERYEFQRSEN